MQTWYVVSAFSDVSGATARAQALGASILVGTPPAGVTVTAWPSVVVTSTATAAAVFPDDSGQATLAEVQAAQTAAATAEATAAQAVTNAKATIQGLLAQQQAFAAQIEADAAMFAASAAGSTVTQAQIDAFVRIVNGFSTVQQALVAHLILTGDYTP